MRSVRAILVTRRRRGRGVLRQLASPALGMALLAGLWACATPHPGGGPAHPPVTAPAAEPRAQPMSEEQASPAPGISPAVLRRLASEPELAAHTAALEAAMEPEQPRLLLARARASIDAAQRLMHARAGGFQALFPPDEMRFVAHYELARADCEEVLAAFPGAVEAAEAQFTLGLIRDYPHLTRFEEALQEYRATVERYPGTVSARKAAERLRAIEEHFVPAVPGAP